MNGPIELPMHPRGVAPRVAGRVLHQWHRLLGHTRQDRARLELVHGEPLLVLPGVFNPRWMRTGMFFSSLLDAGLIAGHTVLDLGTGSGVCAVTAARHARHVIAVDISADAVHCARANAMLRGVQDRLEVRHGDLFEPVEDQRFDLVLFNPPFLRGQPLDAADCAWRSIDIPERFAHRLRHHLQPGGSALLLLSSFGGSPDFLQPLASGGYHVARHATRRYFNETVVVYRVTCDDSR